MGNFNVLGTGPRVVLDSPSFPRLWTGLNDRQMTASRGRVFIWSKLGHDLSEMEVRTFARIEKVIWDQLLATKAEIIQS